MQVFAFIIAIVGTVVFFVDAWLNKSLIALGLGLLAAAWIVELIVTTGTRVTLG